MNLRIVFKFKDCKLQFYEKRRLFSYFSVNHRTLASRWRRLLKLKRKKINSFKIINGFFFTPPLFLATKVTISFVYYSPKTIKCTQKPKSEKRFTGIDQSSERASAILHIISITRSCACAQFTSSLNSLKCTSLFLQVSVQIPTGHLSVSLGMPVRRFVPGSQWEFDRDPRADKNEQTKLNEIRFRR